MHIRSNWYFSCPRAVLGLAGSGFLFGVVMGCAAPGNPLPPSLNLPQVVSAGKLTAERVGDAVTLRWTTPEHTTDKLQVKGAITAEICRDVLSGAVREKAPCVGVAKLEVLPGASEAVDALPADLLTGTPRVLAYRVQLINRAGRTAGPSAAVFAVSGPGVAPLQGFSGQPTKGGVALGWKAEPAAGWVELQRTLLDPAPAKQGVKGGLAAAVPGAGKQEERTRLRAGEEGVDAGGVVDRTVDMGHEYEYTAQRAVPVQAGGRTLEARSVASVTLRFAVRDVFPPEIPQGLVAVPGEGASIELSWDPDIEPRLAGYRVYRRDEDAGAWKRVGPDVVREAAFQDAAVAGGHRYSYRVTAVSTAGNESAASAEVAESAGGSGG